MNHLALLTWTRIVLGPRIGLGLALKFLGGGVLFELGAEMSEPVADEAGKLEERVVFIFFGPNQ